MTGSKPKYIELIEIENKKVFSEMELNFDDKEIIKILDAKVDKVWESIQEYSGISTINEAIYMLPQPFYLHFKTNLLRYTLTIYYNIEQKKELSFFISRLLKESKNGTNNNTTT